LGFYRGLLLINGRAEGGVPVDRTLYQHVWYGVAGQGQVFDRSGHEVPPVMKRAGDVSVGDIVC
jgi:hypothetical protein